MVYAAGRAIVSIADYGVSLDLIRDSSPFVYIIVYFFARKYMANLQMHDKSKVFRFLNLALMIHLLWVAISVLTGNIFGFFQGSTFLSAGIFSVRPDFDSAMIAVYCAILLIQIYEKFSASNFLLLILGIFTVASMQTRAGLISMICCLAVAILYLAKTKRFTINQSFIAVGVLIAVPFVFSFSPAVSRLLVSLGIFTDASVAFESSSLGTINARNLVWQGIIAWTSSDDWRQIFGSGFGNNFLVQSSTLFYLDDSQLNGVRSPHNWFLGMYARLGILGLVIAISLYSFAVLTIARNLFSEFFHDLNRLSGLILIALLPVSLFGVVLEAPFGAIPFYWALGIISTSKITGSSKREDLPAKSFSENLNIERRRKFEQ
jgi:O-antigen ligase